MSAPKQWVIEDTAPFLCKGHSVKYEMYNLTFIVFKKKAVKILDCQALVFCLPHFLSQDRRKINEEDLSNKRVTRL